LFDDRSIDAEMFSEFKEPEKPEEPGEIDV